MKWYRACPMMICAALLAGCSTTVAVNSCDVLRKPPAMKSETRTAIFADRPVAQWVASIDADGRKARCWK